MLVDNPVVRVSGTSNLASLPNKCSLCRSRFDVEEIVNSFIYKNAGNGQYVMCIQRQGEYVSTNCLRIDYQKPSRDFENIQLQVGGKTCRVVRNGNSTSIAHVLLRRLPDYAEIGYNKNIVKDAFMRSFREGSTIEISY